MTEKCNLFLMDIFLLILIHTVVSRSLAALTLCFILSHLVLELSDRYINLVAVENQTNLNSVKSKILSDTFN